MDFYKKYDKIVCNIFHKNFVGHIKQTNFEGLIWTHLSKKVAFISYACKTHARSTWLHPQYTDFDSNWLCRSHALQWNWGIQFGL